MMIGLSPSGFAPCSTFRERQPLGTLSGGKGQREGSPLDAWALPKPLAVRSCLAGPRADTSPLPLSLQERDFPCPFRRENEAVHASHPGSRSIPISSS